MSLCKTSSRFDAPPPTRTLVEQFFDIAGKHPERVAVIDGDRKFSYRELAARVQSISAAIVERSLPGATVGLVCNKSLDLPAALLAILATGRTIVPFDPDYPAPYLRRVAEVARCQLFLADTAWSENDCLLRDLMSREEVLLLKDVATASTTTVPPAPSEDPLAYVLFTSGSTGAPKGVEISVSSLTVLIDSLRALLEFGPEERMLASSSISFDISFIEFFLPLTSGAAVVLAEKRLLLQPKQMSSLCRRTGVTAVQTGPSLWRGLLNSKARFPELNIAISGGEAFPPDLVGLLLEKAKRAWNGYGPTEATIYATYERLSDASIEEADGGLRVSIGRPIGPVGITIRDDEGTELQAGAIGEICISGPTLARGYLNQPTETGERFRSDELGSRYYRTGDVGIMGSDGRISFLGRNDNQFNINGIRFEPEQLETAIRSCRAVKDAAAAAIEGAVGISVVAAIQLDDRETTDAGALRVELERLLPHSVVPSRFCFVELLPRTPSGKLDRKAVAELFAVATHPIGDIVSTDGIETIERVISLASELLGAPDLGADTDIFTVGADSLAALNLMLDIEAEFGCEIRVEEIAQAQTPRAIAELITQPPASSEAPQSTRRRIPNPRESAGLTSQLAAAERFAEENNIPEGWGVREPRPFIVPTLLNTPALPQDILDRLNSLASDWPGEACSDVVPLGLLNSAGKGTPIFWCFNSAREAIELARCLGADQPLYALRSLNWVLPLGEERHAYAEDLGLIYSDEMMSCYPEGPFSIGGNCMAGDVATSAARRLLAFRRQVALLSLLETPIDAPYPGRVALFFGRESLVHNQLLAYHNPELGWRRLARGLTVDEIPGHHGSFFRPPNSISFAERLAARHADALEAALPIVPPSACRAKIEPLSKVPAAQQAGQFASVQFRVWNESDHAWHGSDGGALTLASRWRDQDGTILALGGAVLLKTVVPPGGSVDIRLDFRAPHNIGPHEIEIDLCEEGISWFSARGSSAFRQVVQIGDSSMETRVEHSAVAALRTLRLDEPLPALPARETDTAIVPVLFSEARRALQEGDLRRARRFVLCAAREPKGPLSQEVETCLLLARVGCVARARKLLNSIEHSHGESSLTQSIRSEITFGPRHRRLFAREFPKRVSRRMRRILSRLFERAQN